MRSSVVLERLGPGHPLTPRRPAFTLSPAQRKECAAYTKRRLDNRPESRAPVLNQRTTPKPMRPSPLDTATRGRAKRAGEQPMGRAPGSSYREPWTGAEIAHALTHPAAFGEEAGPMEGHTMNETTTRLVPGQRVQSKQHPELTGSVKHYEYARDGALSPIPYCIEWDDSSRAAELLGWFFVYASDISVQPLPA